jgi:hypothetical protein
MLEGDEEVEDTGNKQFQDNVWKHEKELGMKLFYKNDAQGNEKKRSGTGEDASALGGIGAADCEEFGARVHEVR